MEYMIMLENVCIVIFFFSSRRRHTRYWRDWSSDVCSSDLAPEGFTALASSPSSPVAAYELPDRGLYGIQFHPEVVHTPYRSEERRVGKECRSRWSPYH